MATTGCSDSEKFGVYKYRGYTNSTAVKNKYEELVNAGHKILGGVIVKGGLNDSHMHDNNAAYDAITAGYNIYGGIPYEIAFYSSAYQTIRYNIVIFYI